jgi:transcriptional regulator with XRE-family HTH domain
LLARAVGISQYVLEEIETGRHRAGGPLLIDLAAALSVSIGFFFDQG